LTAARHDRRSAIVSAIASPWRSWQRTWTPPAVGRLTLSYLVGLAVVVVVRVPRAAPLLLPIAALALAVVAAARWGSRSRWGRCIDAFFPIVSLVGTFELTVLVIANANPALWDATFAALDHRLFGALPAAWFAALGRPAWLTDTVSLLYVSFYFVPLIPAVALYRTGRDGEFERLVFDVVGTFLLSYALYLFFPTAGPRMPAELETQVLGGGAISEWVREFLRVAERSPFDAFPSGHAAVACVCLVHGWRCFPRWRAPFALLVAGIIFSTVYLSLHYLVDVVAGVLLAPLALGVLPALRRRLGSPERDGIAAGR